MLQAQCNHFTIPHIHCDYHTESKNMIVPKLHLHCIYTCIPEKNLACGLSCNIGESKNTQWCIVSKKAAENSTQIVCRRQDALLD